MARGIRVAEDDPLFLLLELNEIHFDAIAAKHFHAVNQRVVTDVISQVLAHQLPRQLQPPRCISDAAIARAAERLDAVAGRFARLDDCMASVARTTANATAGVVAGEKLKGIARDVSHALTRVEKHSEQSVAIAGDAKKIVDAARTIQKFSTRISRWWIGTLAVAVLALVIGMAAGRTITTTALEKVQAVCRATTQVR